MSRFQLAVNRLISGTSRFELVYCTHSSWPLPPSNQDKTIVNEPLSVSVLDSSFNPPTIAHAALASAPYAEPTLSCPTVIPRLLLLSISNADKTPKAGDATLAQRLEMMVALADELAVGSGSVGVGALNEPTFVGKSTLLCEQLESGLGESTPSQSNIVRSSNIELLVTQ
jgi:nicotinamide-nucleotide adenylyltransferase